MRLRSVSMDIESVKVSMGTKMSGSERYPAEGAERPEWGSGPGERRHGRASVAAGDPPSIRCARGWIALESSACRRMR